MKTCSNPTCNYSSVPDDAVYCTECGTYLASQTPPTQPRQTIPTLKLPNNTTISIDSDAKVLGRNELLAYLSTLQGVDPKTISRQHFSILQENGKYYIEDGTTIVQNKASTNHTFINGENITGKGKKEITNGTVIDIANTVKVTFTK